LFRGIHNINLDAKSRLALPTRYRDRLQTLCEGQIVITADKDRCLLLYPLPEWEIVEAKLNQLSSFNEQNRRVQRLYLGHATECELDASGRVLLPAMLRDFAGLQKGIVLVGQVNRFEIWDEDAWKKTLEQSINEGISQQGLSPELGAISL